MKRNIVIFTIALIAVSIVLTGCKGKGGGGQQPPTPPTPSVNKVVNPYETYQNDKYGFSFEYPADWYKEVSPEANVIFLSSKEEEPPMGGVSLGARIEIYVIDNSRNYTMEEWLEKVRTQGPTQEIMKTENITIDGLAAVKETYSPFEGPVEAGPPISVYFVNDNLIMQINYTGREPDYFNHLQNFNHLIESLTFTVIY